MNPRTVCFCQPAFSIISGSVAPPVRTSRSRTIAFLLNSRGTLGVLASACGASAAALAALVPFAFFAGLRAAWGAGVGACGAGAASSF